MGQFAMRSRRSRVYRLRVSGSWIFLFLPLVGPKVNLDRLPRVQGLTSDAVLFFLPFASGAGSNEVFAWLLYSASVFLSLFAPKHFSFFHYSVASPLPHHQTIRRSFDFRFHGPWVASIRYSLRSDDKRYKAIRCGLFLPKKGAGTESEKWSAKYPNLFPHLALSK